MKEIHLNHGKVALVDDSDFDALSEFHWRHHRIDDEDYAFRDVYHPETQKSTVVAMHRHILNAPAGMLVDHKDGNGLNNQRFNIRLATRSQNQQNCGPRRNNKSGYKGVCWVKRYKVWKAQIMTNGVNKHLGSFSTPEAAYDVYVKASEEMHGEFGRTTKFEANP